MIKNIFHYINIIYSEHDASFEQYDCCHLSFYLISIVLFLFIIHFFKRKFTLKIKLILESCQTVSFCIELHQTVKSYSNLSSVHFEGSLKLSDYYLRNEKRIPFGNYVNSTFQRLFGTSCAEATGQHGQTKQQVMRRSECSVYPVSITSHNEERVINYPELPKDRAKIKSNCSFWSSGLVTFLTLFCDVSR